MMLYVLIPSLLHTSLKIPVECLLPKEKYVYFVNVCIHFSQTLWTETIYVTKKTTTTKYYQQQQMIYQSSHNKMNIIEICFFSLSEYYTVFHLFVIV